MPSDSDPFGGTAQYYVAHRPGYGTEAVTYVADRFDLDDEARVLDLGCGAGQITIPLARHAGTVVGMDPSEAMLDAARRRAAEAGVENVEWVSGSDADLTPDLGPLRATTMGRAFHWMDQAETLDRIVGTTEDGGGVAVLDDRELLTQGQRQWQKAVYDTATEYLDDLPGRVDPAEVEYDDPYDEVLAENGFSDVEAADFEHCREWTVDGIVGYVFSLSFGSPERFGGDRPAFETAVRDRLAAPGGGPLTQTATVTVVSGRV